MSASVFSPRIASRATRGLNAAEWFRLGFLMDFVPPVTLAARPELVIPLSEKSGATSEHPGHPNNHTLATTLTNLGVLYGKTGDYSRAELLAVPWPFSPGNGTCT